MTIYIEHWLEFFRGQGMDMYWKDNFICPTEEEYKIMAVRSKCSCFPNILLYIKKYQKLNYMHKI